MPSGCASLPSCRGRKGDVAVKSSAGGKPSAKAKEPAKTPTAAKAAPPAAAIAQKAKRKGGPPPAAAAFLAAKRQAEEDAANVADCPAGGNDMRSEDGNDGGGEVEVSMIFDTFDPSQDDFEGMHDCISHMLDSQVFDSDGLARLIIKQSGEVGMVVKEAYDSTVYGVMSVTNLNLASTTLCLAQIGEYVMLHCVRCDEPVRQRVQEKFEKAICGNTGLYISERARKTPLACAVPLFASFLEEVKEAQTGQYKKLREKYGFDEYLILTQIIKRGVCDTNSTNSVEDADETDKKIGAAQGGWKDSEVGGVTWVKAEEEAFLKCSHADFEFELSIAPDGNGVIFGKAMLVKADQMDSVYRAALEMVGRV